MLASQLPALPQHSPRAPLRPPGDCSQEVPRFQADISQKFLAVAAVLKKGFLSYCNQLRRQALSVSLMPLLSQSVSVLPSDELMAVSALSLPPTLPQVDDTLLPCPHCALLGTFFLPRLLQPGFYDNSLPF